MGRSVKSAIERKLKRKKKVSVRRKNLKEALKINIEKKVEVEKELVAARKEIQVIKNRKPEKSVVTSVSRNRCIDKKGCKIPGGTTNLSSDVLSISKQKISEGTFGIVYMGCITKLNIKCAVKSGKFLHLFDANHEANVLQRLQGSKFFPYLFGIFEKSVVMEYIGNENGNLTIYKARNDNLLLQDRWVKVCHMMVQAIVHMHSNGLLHNDIKSNNILLKQIDAEGFIPIIIDMGKATSRVSPEIYKLTPRQRERYNQKYPHLAFELRNKYGSKTSTATDIYSLGFIFKFVADKENDFLQGLQKYMLENSALKRISSPDILRQFKSWIKVTNI